MFLLKFKYLRDGFGSFTWVELGGALHLTWPVYIGLDLHSIYVHVERWPVKVHDNSIPTTLVC